MIILISNVSTHCFFFVDFFPDAAAFKVTTPGAFIVVCAPPLNVSMYNKTHDQTTPIAQYTEVSIRGRKGNFVARTVKGWTVLQYNSRTSNP